MARRQKTKRKTIVDEMIEQHEPHWKRWWTRVLRKGV